MTVLITGATGKIGRVLAGSLADVGLPVTILTRRPHRVFEAFGDSIQTYEWHPISEPVPPAAMTNVNTIVHLMGDPLPGKFTPAKLKRLRASRITSLRRLIEAAGGKPLRLIMASSMGIYPGMGAQSSDVENEQNSVAAGTLPNQLTSALQGVVADWEAAAQPLIEVGSSVVFVRLGHVICPGGFPEVLISLKAQGILCPLAPDCAVPAISLQDAAALFAWLVVNPDVAGPINAVAPKALTGSALNEVLQATAVDGYRIASLFPPLSAWLAKQHLGICADLIYGDRQVVPGRAIAAQFQFSHPDPAGLVRAVVARHQKASSNPGTSAPVSQNDARGTAGTSNDQQRENGTTPGSQQSTND